ncbi:MmyB family transcriptional regulator [Streptomyces alfalfae]|uniref:Helix-turn-helix domain-containing protein n=1 Tax=Streptomyces alfalfae TaxID=1642299 RepID=A0A7T4PD85_9ACTN|nr:helix-turn-helix domain-containing protein [Streptomyces alfalfae]QQC88081.1 helix-turn-helix domain-containing protein [Streptomyces alfalfae]QUI30481.1 helix-turn-helix domain-containing protein [Streptomyces alfalfae]
MPDPRREDLGRMLRAWRMARDPRDLPGPVPFRGHRSYVTQLDMALLLGVSERWYRALERGEDRAHAPELIAGVVRVLALGPAEADALYRGAGLRPPARPAGSAPPPDAAMLDLLHQQRRVSWICDQAWDVVAANTVAARHCPWLMHPGANVMTWAFSPEARYQLRQWETRWAGPLLGLLRLAWQRWPENERLTEVVAAVRAEPGVAALWDTATDLTPLEAEPRPMYFPLVAPDPVDVHVMAYGRFDDTAHRWLVLSPADPAVTFP